MNAAFRWTSVGLGLGLLALLAGLFAVQPRRVWSVHRSIVTGAPGAVMVGELRRVLLRVAPDGARHTFRLTFGPGGHAEYHWGFPGWSSGRGDIELKALPGGGTRVHWTEQGTEVFPFGVDVREPAQAREKVIVQELAFAQKMAAAGRLSCGKPLYNFAAENDGY